MPPQSKVGLTGAYSRRRGPDPCCRRSIPPPVLRPGPQERHCEEQRDAAIYEIRGSRLRGSAWAYSRRLGRCSPPMPKHCTYRSSPHSTKASLRGAERRGNLRDPRFSFTGIGLGVLAAPGPVLPAHAEALYLPFLAALRKSVIARSRATRQSTRSGVFVYGDRPGRTRGAWAGAPRQCRSTVPTVPRRTPQERHCEEQCDAAIYEMRGFRLRGLAWAYSRVVGRMSGHLGSLRLPRRSVMPVPELWRFEPQTRLTKIRFTLSATPRNDVLISWVVGTRGVFRLLAMTCSLVGWWEQ